MKSFYVIDGHSQLYKAFYAVPSLTSPSGQPTNAILGFLKIMHKIIYQRSPDYLAITFDAKGPTFRHKLAETYKANRPPMPDDLSSQIPVLMDIIDAYGIPVFTKEGFEADDILATITNKLKPFPDINLFLVTSDKDAWQLISDRVKLFETKSDLVRGREWLKKEKLISPDQVIDYLAMIGDTSDNIPGIPGVGPKTATKLLAKYHSIDNMLEHLNEFKGKLKQTLEQYKSSEDLANSRELITLVSNLPIDFNLAQCERTAPDKDRLLPMIRELGFKKLANEIDQMAGSAGNPAAAPENKTASASLAPETPVKTIKTPPALADLIAQLAGAPHFAVDVETDGTNPFANEITGFYFAQASDELFYVPLSATIDNKKTVALIKKLLEDPSAHKYCYDAKFMTKMLRRLDVKPKGIKLDVMLAAHVLDPSRKHNDFSRVIFDFLQEDAGEGDIIKIGHICRLADKMRPLLEKQELLALLEDVEIPVAEVLAEMELNGIAIDKKYFLAMSKQLDSLISLGEQTIFELAGEEFTINSPKQLGTILFEKLCLPTQRKTKTGYSTDESVMTKLAKMHPLPAHILQYRNLTKLKSTYVDTLPSKIDPLTNRIHTNFGQTGTETGRLSSSDPNLQNIPTRTALGKTVRAGFIPSAGCEFLSADYSQIELRMLAHFSNDPELCRAFGEGEDIHRLVAAQIHGLNPKEVSDEERSRAKAVNFGIIYGQTPFGLSRNIGISVEDATSFINSYFLRYSKVKDFIDETINAARMQGFVKTILNRRRPIPGINSSNHNERGFAERMAVNTIIQGSAADLIKHAMINIHRQLRKNKFATKMILQIHDELLFEVPSNEVTSARTLIKNEMENALSLKVPLIITIGVGKNWLEVK